jgi:N-acyl-D-amino-acid deacylase
MGHGVDRRRFIGSAGAGLAGLAMVRVPRVAAAPAFDLVLEGGSVLDGTGAPAFPADVGIAGDRIEAVGSIAASQAKRVVDVSGLHVCPGFVDIHSHSDGSILSYPGAESRALQGVTTEITGNCGSSAAPFGGVGADERRKDWADDGVQVDWTGVASFCARLEKARFAVNQALLLGQGTLRENAIGMADRPLAADELAAVLRAVEEGMDQGAFGLSTGLEYTPGRYTPTDEVVAMARVVARRGGFYATHSRNEEAMLLEAVNEALEIGRRAGLRVEISHLKAAGRRNWPKQQAALDLIEAARASGVEVLADAYPYTAYSTGLSIFLEAADLEGGTSTILARLRDPQARARIRKALPERMASEPGDWELVVLSSVKTEKNRWAVGKHLGEVAASWQVEPAEALLRLLDEEETAVSYIGHGMSPENVERVLAHPLVMIGSDGYSMAPVGRAAQTRPHPRSYGTYPRVLGHYARERKLFDLPTAVRKMTSLPADQAGIADRGRIARGKKADIVCFDPATVADAASFEEPHRYPAGIPHVLVNGVLVVENGRPTGARPGRALRKA